MDRVQILLKHKGYDCSKCSECWKVYGDEQTARILFKKYKKCTEIYRRKWKSGVAVEQFTVTI